MKLSNACNVNFSQMIKSKVGSIKSGWRSVFMVFTTAAYDNVESISDVAFENVEQGILFMQLFLECGVPAVVLWTNY